MELGPKEINEKQFHDAWRGYNQEEVDDFLDRVADAVDALQRENDPLRERLQDLDKRVESGRDTEEMLRKTLASAQDAAQEAIAAAKAKADQIVADAEERAQRARDELRTRVETAEEEVRKRAAAVEAEQESLLRLTQESIDRLEGFESDLKKKLQAFFEQQAQVLATLQERPDPESIEIVTDEPVLDLDAAEDSAPAEVIDPEPRGLDIEDPNLDDFRPFDDEEEAFGSGRRRKRGLFRRDRDVEDLGVHSEEG